MLQLQPKVPQSTWNKNSHAALVFGRSRRAIAYKEVQQQKKKEHTNQQSKVLLRRMKIENVYNDYHGSLMSSSELVFINCIAKWPGSIMVLGSYVSVLSLTRLRTTKEGLIIYILTNVNESSMHHIYIYIYIYINQCKREFDAPVEFTTCKQAPFYHSFSLNPGKNTTSDSVNKNGFLIYVYKKFVKNICIIVILIIANIPLFLTIHSAISIFEW